MFQRRHTGLALGWAVIVVFATALTFTVLGTASAVPAAAPGTYTITVTGGDGAIGTQALKIAPACSNGSDDDLDTTVDHPDDLQCASSTDSNEGPDNTEYVPPTFEVDIDADGNVSAPAANVKWQDIWQRQDTGVLGVKDLLVRFVADDVGGKSVTGHLDAATGELDLTWRFHIETSVFQVPGRVQIGTPANPLEAKLSSSTAGGSAFDPLTLAAGLVDDQIVYPEAACVDSVACPMMISAANTKLGLPTAPGASPLKVTGVVDRNPIVGEPPPDVPDLSLTKSHSGDFEVGVDGTYALVVSNVGAVASSGEVTVDDALPTGLDYKGFAGDGWSCAPGGQVVTCTSSAPIAAGADASVLSLTVTPSEAATVTNSATVSGGGQSNLVNDGAADETVVVGGDPPPDVPDLSLAKSHSGDFEVGVDGTYALVVSNVGAVASSGEVTVDDALPTGLDYKGFAGDGWSCAPGGQVVTCTSSAPIAAGADASALSLTVTPSEAATVTNTATVSGGGQTNTLNDGASDPTTIAGEPPPDEADLSLTKSHTGDFTVGVDGTYALAVTNVGGAATTGDVRVEDTLPTELGYKGSTGAGWSCGAEGQVVTCTSSAPIAAGAAAEALSLTVTPSEAATVTNTATVSGGGQANTLNDGASDPTVVVGEEPPGPELALTKTHEGNFTVGVEGTWVLRVANVGEEPTTEPIALADQIPAEVEFVSVTLEQDSGWVCGADAGLVTCTNAGPIAAGATLAPVGVVVEPKSAGTATNIAAATSGELTASASDAAVVDAAQPALVVDLEASEMQVGVQSTIAFTVENSGTGPTTGPVELSIPLPLDLVLTNATGSGWACRNAGTTASVMDIACTTNAVAEPGASLPVVNVLVTPKTAGTFPIGATVSTSGSADGAVTADVVVAGSSTPGPDDPAKGDPASGMPFTGGELAVLLDTAMAALGLGGGLVGWSRTRRRRRRR